MKRFAFRYIGHAALVLAIALVAGCGTTASPSTPAQPSAVAGATAPSKTAVAAAPVPTVKGSGPASSTGGTPVKIQVSGTVAEGPMYLAVERGYFAEQGVSPQFVTFDSAQQVIPALSTGQIDVGAGSLGASLFNAVNSGIGIRVGAPQSENRDRAHSSTWILVRKDLAEGGVVRSPADLRGLKIAINGKAGTSEYLTDVLLRKGNLQPMDAEYVQMGFGDMGAAFGGRTIDVAVDAEPTATSYVDKGLATKWLSGADVIPTMQYTYLLYSPQFADQHTDLAQRWMTAYLRGARDWQTMLETGQDRDGMLGILAKYTPVKDLSLLQRISIPVPSAEAKIDIANITNQITWAHERGYITREPSVTTLVDTRFVERATQPAKQ